jgi:hypothetical protein
VCRGPADAGRATAPTMLLLQQAAMHRRLHGNPNGRAPGQVCAIVCVHAAHALTSQVNRASRYRMTLTGAGYAV